MKYFTTSKLVLLSRYLLTINRCINDPADDHWPVIVNHMTGRPGIIPDCLPGKAAVDADIVGVVVDGIQAVQEEGDEDPHGTFEEDGQDGEDEGEEGTLGHAAPGHGSEVLEMFCENMMIIRNVL